MKIKNILLFLLILIFGIFSVLSIFQDNNKEEKNEEVLKEEIKIEEYSASLVMVGDALVNNSLYFLR